MDIEEIELKLFATEKRLNEIERRLHFNFNEDIEEIKKLHNCYANALINVDWDDIIDCLTADSSIDVQFGGLIKCKSDISHFFKEMLSQIHIGKEALAFFLDVIEFRAMEVEGEGADQAQGDIALVRLFQDKKSLFDERGWIGELTDHSTS